MLVNEQKHSELKKLVNKTGKLQFQNSIKILMNKYFFNTSNTTKNAFGQILTPVGVKKMKGDQVQSVRTILNLFKVTLKNGNQCLVRFNTTEHGIHFWQAVDGLSKEENFRSEVFVCEHSHMSEFKPHAEHGVINLSAGR